MTARRTLNLFEALVAGAAAAACASSGSSTVPSTASTNVAQTEAATTAATAANSGADSARVAGGGGVGKGAGMMAEPSRTDSAAGSRVAGGSAGAMAAGAASAAAGVASAAMGATSDANVVALLHESNMAELTAGQLAQQRAQSAAVKNFARQMLTDHTALDLRGNSLASQAGITPTLPDSTLPQQNARDEAALEAAGSGSAFDRVYVAQQVAAHQRTLALVDASLGIAQNAALKAALQSEVRPRISTHLQQAQALQRQVGTAP